MYTIDKEYINELLINKSRFICYLAPANSVDEANEYLQQIRKKHYDATHNCYAYIIGSNGEVNKNSDDGEPSQTAGLPMLNVLQKNNLTNIIAIVTRYFGGIKLGAGGLIRAYSSSVANTLVSASLKKLYQVRVARLIFAYPYHNDILQLLQNYQILDQQFTDVILLDVEIPIEEIESLHHKLINITKDNIDFAIISDEYQTF